MLTTSHFYHVLLTHINLQTSPHLAWPCPRIHAIHQGLNDVDSWSVWVDWQPYQRGRIQRNYHVVYKTALSGTKVRHSLHHYMSGCCIADLPPCRPSLRKICNIADLPPCRPSLRKICNIADLPPRGKVCNIADLHPFIADLPRGKICNIADLPPFL